MPLRLGLTRRLKAPLPRLKLGGFHLEQTNRKDSKRSKVNSFLGGSYRILF
jgi:hypothetical protein